MPGIFRIEHRAFGVSLSRPAKSLWTCLCAFAFGQVARAEPCQNQAVIDVCKAGCTATSVTCGALCGAAVDVCTNVCIGGCATTCAIDCCAGFCTDSDECHDCIGDCEDSCHNGCQLDCDDCILNCNHDCESICVPFRKVGEFCTPLFDRCADGLTCWPLPFPGELRPRCFPPESDNIFPDDVCRSFYSPGVHEVAMAKGVTNSYGIGSSAGAGVAGGIEEGVVYGADGRFGCYLTTCIGVLIDASFGSYAGIGLYVDYDSFYGTSVVEAETVGKGINFTTAQVYSSDLTQLIGTTDALSLGIGVLPLDVGLYYCTTIVDTVGTHNPDGSLAPVTNTAPLAICNTDVHVCANSKTCSAAVTLDGGSTDPDGDLLTMTQVPPGPYAIGEWEVMLTVRDPDGAGDSCSAVVTVSDCDPPGIQCPDPIVTGCEERNGTTFVDPGSLLFSDCSDVVIVAPEPDDFPLGTTVVTYTATDALGLQSSCDLEITIDEPDSDGDGIVDCMDHCPTIKAFSATGCGGLVISPPSPDSDGDGVPDAIDGCPNTDQGVAVDGRGCPSPPPTSADSDGDGVNDDFDQCPDTVQSAVVDSAGCPREVPPGAPLPDADGDGINDAVDTCPDTFTGAVVDAAGCPTDASADADGDGVPDAQDGCSQTPHGANVDANGCESNSNAHSGGGQFRLPCGPINAAALLPMLSGLAVLRMAPRRFAKQPR